MERFHNQKMLLLAAFALGLLASLAPQAALAVDDDSCSYPGFRGGPFPGTPACTEGFKTEPLTCMNCTRSWDPSVDERIICEDDDDCVSLVGKYMSCSGPIGPFLVDDDDNIYFWSGRWQLHSLDKHGNLRWRFTLCNPPEDSLCAPAFPNCQPEAARMVPMVMDYQGTLFFFIGNVLYAISSDGELVLKHRVQIPGYELPEGWTLEIGTGSVEFGGSSWGNLAGSPVLHTDGSISVAYGVGGWESREADMRPSGVLRLSRTGEVLAETNFLWRSTPNSFMGVSRLLGTQDEQLAYVGVHTSLPNVDDYDPLTHFYLLDEVQSVWKAPVPLDYSIPGQWSMELFQPEMAVGPQGRIYGLTEHGVVYAFDPGSQTKRRIFHFRNLNSYTWQNRPVVAADGTIYFTANEILQGGSVWALDSEKLWQNPDSAPRYESLPIPEDHPGIKWGRVYGGSGGWTTPVLSKNGRVYVGMGGIAAHDAQTGEQIWWFGKRTMGSAPTILSDGTVVVGQGITGRIFFLKEDTPNGGMADEGWPTARHDRYLSNNANHPFRWDRSGDPPYEPVTELLEDAPPCWNEADWDVEECGPLPEPERPSPEADAGGAEPDAGSDTGDAQSPSDTSPTPPGDADTSDDSDAQDGKDTQDAETGTDQDASPEADKSSESIGCRSTSSPPAAPPWLLLAGLGGLGLFRRL